MICLFRNESGAEIVESLIEDDQTICLAHAINICEVYYDFLRAKDETTALAAIHDLQLSGVIVRDDMDAPFWQQVGKYKVLHRLSLADCFALALATREQGELITTDHHEFDPLLAGGNYQIRFAR